MLRGVTRAAGLRARQDPVLSDVCRSKAIQRRLLHTRILEWG
jgi:hypothetical protein